MLYCQPNSFYEEMCYISDNRPQFIQKMQLTEYQIPDNVDNIDPVVYLIKMAVSEPVIDSNRIFALRTYGTYNSMIPSSTDRTMQIYYATYGDGSFHISKPSTADIEMRDNVLVYTASDEYGDLYEFTFEDIAKDTYKNPYALGSYISYHDKVFEPANIMAKIPVHLLNYLV